MCYTCIKQWVVRTHVRNVSQRWDRTRHTGRWSIDENAIEPGPLPPAALGDNEWCKRNSLVWVGHSEALGIILFDTLLYQPALDNTRKTSSSRHHRAYRHNITHCLSINITEMCYWYSSRGGSDSRNILIRKSLSPNGKQRLPLNPQARQMEWKYYKR